MEPVYDAIVVNSGFACRIVARRLTARGCRVCVLERGFEQLLKERSP